MTRIGAEHRVAGLAGRGSSGPRRVCGASGTHNGTAGHCPGQADRADGRALHGDRPSVRKSKAKRLGSNRPHAGKIRIAFPQQFEERLQSPIKNASRVGSTLEAGGGQSSALIHNNSLPPLRLCRPRAWLDGSKVSTQLAQRRLGTKDREGSGAAAIIETRAFQI